MLTQCSSGYEGASPQTLRALACTLVLSLNGMAHATSRPHPQALPRLGSRATLVVTPPPSPSNPARRSSGFESHSCASATAGKMEQVLLSKACMRKQAASRVLNRQHTLLTHSPHSAAGSQLYSLHHFCRVYTVHLSTLISMCTTERL